MFEKPAENLLAIIVIAFCLINLLVTAAYGIGNSFKFDKKLAYLTGFLYIVFFIAATGV